VILSKQLKATPSPIYYPTKGGDSGGGDWSSTTIKQSITGSSEKFVSETGDLAA
jgi:hypothetical protein